MFFDVLGKADSADSVAVQALRSVFGRDRLEEMLRLRLGRRLDDISVARRLRTIVFDVVTTADDEGWFAELLAASKSEFPGNERFVAECDKALALHRARELPQEEPPEAPPARRRNLLFCGIMGVLAVAWGVMVAGVAAVYGLLGVAVTWLGSNTFQAFFKSRPLRWLDGLLCRAIDSPRTTWILSGAMGVGLLASLFVGSIEGPPPEDELDVRIVPASCDAKGSTLKSGSLRFFGTTPWSPRTVAAQAEGYEAEVSVFPWWRKRLRGDDFHLVPYVLLVPDNAIAGIISRQEPWRLEVIVDSEARTHVVEEYFGEPVLLGDTERRPWMTLPSPPPNTSTSFGHMEKVMQGRPVVPQCPVVHLRPDMGIRARLLAPGGSQRTEVSFRVRRPAGRKDAVSLEIIK